MSLLSKNPGSGDTTPVSLYANTAAFPATGYPGSLAVALDTYLLYILNAATGVWTQVGGSGTDPLALHRDNSQPPTANIDWNQFNLTNVREFGFGVTASGKYNIKTLFNTAIIQQQTSGASSFIDLYAFDSDGTDIVGYSAFAKGTSSFGGASEFVDMSWRPGESQFVVQAGYFGGGVARPLSLRASAQNGGNPLFPNQLQMRTSGDVSTTGNLLFSPDNTKDLGSPDAGATFLRPAALYVGALGRIGAETGEAGVLNVGATSGVVTICQTELVQGDPANPFTIAYNSTLALSIESGFVSTPFSLRLSGEDAGFQILEGTAGARMGIATLVVGTATVACTSVTADSRIFITAQSPGGTMGTPFVSARTPGVSFEITSTSLLDTSVVAYQLVEPTT